MKLMRIFVTVLFIITTPYLSACDDDVIKTKKFDKVISIINAKIEATKKDNEKPCPEKVLVVFDLDDTLLTSSTDFGSDLWYRWQRKKLDMIPDAEDGEEIKPLFEIIGFLYDIGSMKLIESNVPARLTKLQKRGIASLILTSRSPKYRAATARELKKHEFTFNQLGLTPKGQEPSLYFKKFNIGSKKPTYLNGLFMTEGADKGIMLTMLLATMNRNFEHIIFVDDSCKNVCNVSYLKDKFRGVKFTIIHYTKVDDDIRPLTENTVGQMKKGWNNLKKFLLAEPYKDKWEELIKPKK